MTDCFKCNSVNDSTILQNDDNCFFTNNSKYEIVIPKGTSVYYCPECTKWFKSLEDFSRHVTHNTSEKKL